jgi:predicted pyridoxine 5'-phosphate oxidase superfamily flavin-nucleotide-binding protein
MHIVTSVEELKQLYGDAGEASITKVTSVLTPHYSPDDRSVER